MTSPNLSKVVVSAGFMALAAGSNYLMASTYGTCPAGMVEFCTHIQTAGPIGHQRASGCWYSNGHWHIECCTSQSYQCGTSWY